MLIEFNLNFIDIFRIKKKLIIIKSNLEQKIKF